MLIWISAAPTGHGLFGKGLWLFQVLGTIMESLRVEKAFRITKSNCCPRTIKPCPQVQHPLHFKPLKNSRDDDSHDFPGQPVPMFYNPFQEFFFLISDVNQE